METAIEDRLDEAEPIVRRLAAKHAHVVRIGADDFAQELRIQVLKMADQFDPAANVPWIKYVASFLPRRAIDVCRDCGGISRGGHLRFRAVPISQIRNPEFEDTRLAAFDRCDEFGGDGVDAVDWQDFVSRVQSEPLGVRAFVASCSGLTNVEIARRNNLSESRISQVLRTEAEHIKARVKSILHEPRARKPITPPKPQKPPKPRKPIMAQTVPATAGQATAEPSDPVDRMLNAFENATPETLDRVDARIQVKLEELERLKRMRAALAKTLGLTKTKPAKPKDEPKLGDRIYDAIIEGTEVRVEELVTTLDVSNQAIRVAARRSKRLDIKGDMVSRRV